MSDVISTPSLDISISYTPRVGFITDETFDSFKMVCLFALLPALHTWALFSVAVNIITFVKMGVREGINSVFLILPTSNFFLAVSEAADLCLSCMIFVNYEALLGLLPVNELLNLLKRTRNFPWNTSLFITTEIAVVRCCLVVMPLRAQNLVTVPRQLLSILVLCAATLFFYIAVFSNFKLLIITLPRTNTTILKFSNLPVSVSNTVDAFHNLSLFISLSVILISTIVLAIFLKQAFRFRKTAMSSSAVESNTHRKEVQVIKCVVLLMFVFITCNIPYLTLTILRLQIPTFRHFGPFRNDHRFLGLLLSVFSAINVGSNIFVYYSFNSKFRLMVRSMFGIDSTMEDKKGELKSIPVST